MVKACFDNLAADEPKRNFVVGIDDDVTYTSIPYGEPFTVLPEGTV